MAKKQANPKRYRTTYTEENIKRAFWLVRTKRVSVRKAAWRCGIPAQTLRDRLTHGQESPRPLGGPTLFTREEESKLVEHILKMASIGYPLSRCEVISIATDTAILSGSKSSHSKQLSRRWYERFLKRWPQLKYARAQKLNIKRARATSEETVTNYFTELENILDKYDLRDKPQFIFNVDETGFQGEHKPPKVVGACNQKLNSITSERGATTTVLACGSASGQFLPPFFIFKGKRTNEKLMEGALHGSRYAMTDSGWSNGEIFLQFIEEHFVPALPRREDNQHVLLLYDGHASHISLKLIDIAKKHNIILFVLPPHSSHILQPLDVGLFNPLKCHFNQECHREMRSRAGEVLTRYDACKLISKSFIKAFTPVNLIQAFKATGIFPLNPGAVHQAHYAPAKHLNNAKKRRVSTDDDLQTISTFLDSKVPTPKDNVQTKTRNYSYRPGGVAITETSIILKIKKVQEEKEKKKGRTEVRSKRCPQQPDPELRLKSSNADHLPSTSTKRIPDPPSPMRQREDSVLEDDFDRNDVCCVCNKFSPDGLKSLNHLKIVDWAKCDQCNHWVHLEFCHQMKSNEAIKNSFLCIHCDVQEE